MKRFGDEKPFSVDWADHKELTTLCSGFLYFCTSLSPPTEFKTRENAEEAMKKSKKIWPMYKFKVIDIEELRIIEEERKKEKEISRGRKKEKIDMEGEVPF
jgi:hypothetical protein